MRARRRRPARLRECVPAPTLWTPANNLQYTTQRPHMTAAAATSVTATTMGDLTQEHRRARNGGAAQAVVAVALCIFWLDAGALTALLVPAGIALMLSSPTNIAYRATVNWSICTVTALGTAVYIAFLWIISSGALASLVTTSNAERFCRSMARQAYPRRGDPDQMAQLTCNNVAELRQLEDMLIPSESLDQLISDGLAKKATAGSAGDGICRADCMAAWHIVTSDSSVLIQAIQGDPFALPSSCVFLAFLVACAWTSSRAGPKRSLGEPQDLPEYRMGPVHAIVRGMRKSFQKAGRASRSEYWSYVLFVTFALLGLADLSGSMPMAGWQQKWMPGEHHPDLLLNEAAEFLSVCLPLLHRLSTATLVLSLLSATVRRLHDTSHSGSWLLTLFVPVLNVLTVLPISFWLMRGSLAHLNAFGSVPMNGSWHDECEPSQPSGDETGVEHVAVDTTDATDAINDNREGEPHELLENWMGPINAIASGVSKTFTKAGRASRSEYWWYMLFGPGVLIVLAALGESEKAHEIRHAQVPRVFDEMTQKPLSDRQIWAGTPVAQFIEAAAPPAPPTLPGDVASSERGQQPMRILQSMMAFDALVAVVIATAVLISFLFATVRRLHDTGRSGWRLLLLLVPVLNMLSMCAILLWLVQPSEARRNEYGSVPTNDAWRDVDGFSTPVATRMKDQPTHCTPQGTCAKKGEPKGEGCRSRCDCENPMQEVEVDARESLPQHLRHAVD
eukprot:COSAG02_NODE_13_length_57813_cov_14.298276_29_plen_733_part_00